MQKIQFIFFLFIVCETTLVAQTMTAQEAQTNLNVVGGAGYTARTFDNRYEGVKGFPTFLEKPAVASIYQTDGRKIVSRATNLDLTSHELIVVKNNQEWILSKAMVRNVTFFNGKDSISFCKENIGNKGEMYFQNLTKGPYQLLLLITKSFVKADFQGAYSADRTYDEFKASKKMYLKLSEAGVVEVKNKKDLIRAIPDRESDISSYVKNNLLDLKNEDHMISLIEFLNKTNDASQ